MVPEKGKAYHIKFETSDYPKDTHYTGPGIYLKVDEDNSALYEFELLGETCRGSFEEKYIEYEIETKNPTATNIMSEDFNTIAADRIICPHCGGTDYDNDLQMCDLSGAPMEYECEHCLKDFELTAEISVTYSTRKLKNEEVWYTAQEN